MIGESLPKISCTLVTKGRVNLLKRAVDCYLSQTYAHRELVVLSQGDDTSNEAIAHYLNGLGRQDILFFVASPRLSLGAMRNTSVEIARGEVICQWDDDDLYHPDRLATQFRALRSCKQNLASVYCDFLKYFKPEGELYWCDWSKEPLPSHRYLCGSIMFYKRLFHDYLVFYPQSGPLSCVEEDLHVIEKVLWKGDIAPVFAGHQYIYVFHGGNTYDRDHHLLTLNTTWGKKVFSEQELLENRALLEDTFRKVGLSDKIHVRSKDKEAFTYEV